MSVRRGLKQTFVLILGCSLLSGCYFFKKTNLSEDSSSASATGGVLGLSLGTRAGSEITADLENIRAISSSYAPAAIRPDPDVYIRQLLLQYRQEGSIVAREIARVERYRELLGGASEDFTTVPQETYDATSLLASYKVAEEVCRGLVNPNQWEHGDWSTILPASADQTDTNLRYLAQRFLGLPSVQISDSTISSLQSILDASLAAEVATAAGRYSVTLSNSTYIPVCATLAVDAEGLLL